ncbi:hypothetical protein LCGC14_3011960 [marine sediment metagenome]|uniref:Uncharacterized protein n=1 Tax=marine sediment metagenome TaxID=412755 RepID=A0A0F8Z5K1_9ZZZZ
MPRSYWTELTEVGTIETTKMTFGKPETYQIKLVNSVSEIKAHLAMLETWLMEDEQYLAGPRTEGELPEDLVLMPLNGDHGGWETP